jgi:putative hydrolase
MRILGDYHTHTTYSHGLGSIEDNVKAALEKGLKVIAITDHGFGHLGFGVKKYRFKDMRREIDALKSVYPQIDILLGVEANLLSIDGDLDLDDSILPYFDILICGYHFGSTLKNWWRDAPLHLCNMLKKVHPYFYEKAKQFNTRALIGAMDKYPLFFISHPGAKGPIDVKKVARKAFEKNVLLEINNSHGHLTVKDILLAKGENAKFIINSDAHHPSRVGTFELSLERAALSGLEAQDIFNASVL